MILLIFQINPTHTSVFSGDFVHLSLIVLLFFSPSGLSVELYGAINFSPPPRARTVTTDCGTFSSPSSFFFVTNLITAALSSLPWCPGPSFAVLHFCLDDIFVELPQEMSVTLFVLICGLRWREVVQHRCPVVPDPPHLLWPCAAHCSLMNSTVLSENTENITWLKKTMFLIIKLFFSLSHSVS